MKRKSALHIVVVALESDTHRFLIRIILCQTGRNVNRNRIESNQTNCKSAPSALTQYCCNEFVTTHRIVTQLQARIMNMLESQKQHVSFAWSGIECVRMISMLYYSNCHWNEYSHQFMCNLWIGQTNNCFRILHFYRNIFQNSRYWKTTEPQQLRAATTNHTHPSQYHVWTLAHFSIRTNWVDLLTNTSSKHIRAKEGGRDTVRVRVRERVCAANAQNRIKTIYNYFHKNIVNLCVSIVRIIVMFTFCTFETLCGARVYMSMCEDVWVHALVCVHVFAYLVSVTHRLNE